MTNHSTIKYVNVDWLKANLTSKYRLLDFQPDVHDYIKEHIPGAVYINEKHFRYYHHHLPAEYVPTSIIETILSQAGVNNSSPVVIYAGQGRFSEQGDGLEQSMAAYTLARFGHEEIYLLNGGIDAWIEASLELDCKFPVVEQNTFITNVRNDFFVNYSQFNEMKNNPQTTIIDIRPHSVYEGKSVWCKPGHIPGAINLPWRSLMSPSNANMLRPEHQIRELISERNLSPEQMLLLYCGTGREATCAFIVFKYVMNFPNVRIYEGSFTEWCTYPDNKTVTGPNPL